jgi:hypothetical protein
MARSLEDQVITAAIARNEAHEAGDEERAMALDEMIRWLREKIARRDALASLKTTRRSRSPIADELAAFDADWAAMPRHEREIAMRENREAQESVNAES